MVGAAGTEGLRLLVRLLEIVALTPLLQFVTFQPLHK